MKKHLFFLSILLTLSNCQNSDDEENILTSIPIVQISIDKQTIYENQQIIIIKAELDQPANADVIVPVEHSCFGTINQHYTAPSIITIPKENLISTIAFTQMGNTI